MTATINETTTIDNHDKAVAEIRNSIRSFYNNKQKFRVFHGSTTTTRSSDIDPMHMIDVSGLNEILEINVKDRYAVVESNVAMDQLVAATLKYGLVPPVVPELPAITVGGSVQGGAGESSSFKWGCFHETCLEYEVILGDGSLLNVSKSENQELYDGMPCSYGSVGIVTKIKLSLIPAKPYVEINYLRVAGFQDVLESLKNVCNSNVDFVDAIMFSKAEGVVIRGKYSLESPLPLTTTRRAKDEWYYLNVLNKLRKSQNFSELMPLEDYLFRYEKGAFWVARNGFEMFRLPYTRMTRMLFSSLVKNRTMYAFLNSAKLSQQYLVQDVCIPIERTEEVLDYIDSSHSIYPLWLCPLKPTFDSYLSPNALSTDLVINIGVWGKLDSDYARFMSKSIDFEDKVSECGGRKVLYGHVYQDKTNFWKSYDKKRYQELRRTYKAEQTLPDIYQKVHVTEVYKPSIRDGIAGALKQIYRDKRR